MQLGHEIQHKSSSEKEPDGAPCNILVLNTPRAETREGEKKQSKPLGGVLAVEHVARTVETIQHLIDDLEKIVGLCGVKLRAEPIDIDYDQNYTDSTEKIHDFRQCPEVIFLLRHCFSSGFEVE